MYEKMLSVGGNDKSLEVSEEDAELGNWIAKVQNKCTENCVVV